MNEQRLETIALRALELATQSRADPRLLVATKRHLPKPKRAAKLIAALANAAAGRQALMLIGVRGMQITGLASPPSDQWWTAVTDALPGAVPDLDWAMIDVGDIDILAIAIGQPDELVVATRRGGAFVPWFDGTKLADAPLPQRREAHSRAERVPEVRVLGGWVERSCLSGLASPVSIYRGIIDMELEATAGAMDDAACSATLLLDDLDGPVTLEVQVHPLGNDAGVTRNERGITVRSTFGIRVYVAAATPPPAGAATADIGAAQLVVSLPLPGRSVPELRSLLLSPVSITTGTTRWRL